MQFCFSKLYLKFKNIYAFALKNKTKIQLLTTPNCMEKEQLEHASNYLFLCSTEEREVLKRHEWQKLMTEFVFGLTISLIPNLTEDKPMRK